MWEGGVVELWLGLLMMCLPLCGVGDVCGVIVDFHVDGSVVVGAVVGFGLEDGVWVLD